MQTFTRLLDVTEIDYDAAVAFALAYEAAGLGSAEQGLVELDELVVLMAMCYQVELWWAVAVVEPAAAYRGELAASAERERVRLSWRRRTRRAGPTAGRWRRWTTAPSGGSRAAGWWRSGYAARAT
jgi:hypothetical protein